MQTSAHTAMDQPTDRRLSSQVSVSVDPDLIAALYRSYSRELLAYGRSLTFDEELIKDAIQDVFYRLLLSLEGINEVRNHKVYLSVALKNYIAKEAIVRKNHRRHQQRYSISEERFSRPAWYQDHHERDAHYKQCVEAMDRLPPRERDILRMRYLEGLDYKEISVYTSGNHQVVRNYACRAIKRLRREITLPRPTPSSRRPDPNPLLSLTV